MTKLKNNLTEKIYDENLKENTLTSKLFARELIKKNLTELDFYINDTIKDTYSYICLDKEFYDMYEDMYLDLCEAYEDIYKGKYFLYKKEFQDLIYLNNHLTDRLAKIIYNTKLVYNKIVFLENNSIDKFMNLKYIETLPIEDIFYKSEDLVMLELNNLLITLDLFRLKIESLLEKINCIEEASLYNKKNKPLYKMLDFLGVAY